MEHVDERRHRVVHEGETGQGPVCYWMQRDQRVQDNWALLYAQELALKMNRPLAVIFCMQRTFLQASADHFAFMQRGLIEVEEEFKTLNISFFLLEGAPHKILQEVASHLDVHSLITDFNPVRIKQEWLDQLSPKIQVPVIEVDAHNIIPCWLASPKQEYAAYTFRPKVNAQLSEYLTFFPQVSKHPFPLEKKQKERLAHLRVSTESLGVVSEHPWVSRAGAKAGSSRLQEFIHDLLNRYATERNDPLQSVQSDLSPYFHFGQLAPQRAALKVIEANCHKQAREDFLEELIVRRELSDNYCYYCADYDNVNGFPQWAMKTLDEHRRDKRQYIYSDEEFDQGLTHERLWNVCQKVLREQGKLHGYLRMYWAKKILEWSASPEDAMQTAITLNDTYAFDGRDPNGYVGVAWSIGGVHDRAWAERPVFGKIRYMNENGCKRKFDVAAYIARHGT